MSRDPQDAGAGPAAVGGVFLERGAGRAFDLGPRRTVVKVGAAETGARFVLWESAHEPGFRAETHVHHQADEAFYVLRGQYRVSRGDVESAAGPGAFVLIPRGLPHGFVAGPEGGEMLVFEWPPGDAERYLAELGSALARGGLDQQAARALARRHDVDFL